MPLKDTATEPIEFTQIAAAKDHLYGITRAGTVYRYDDDRRCWDPLPMVAPGAPTRCALASRTS